MAKTLRLGFIGSGGIADYHIAAMRDLPNVTLAGFCDVRAERAEACAAQTGGEAFSDPEQMLAKLDLDAVWIMVPPFAHGEAEAACLRHRVPFMVEKPVHLDPKQAAKIAAQAEKAGVIAGAAYMNRYRKSLATARKVLADDPPVYAWGGWLGKAMENPEHWWIRKEQSGGQFLEQATHTVDLARYLMGDAATVTALPARGFVTHIPNYDLDDALAVSIQFRNGSVANLCSCCAARARGGIFLDLYAQQATVKFSQWSHDAEIWELGKKKPRLVPGESEVEIFRAEDVAFLKAVRSGDPSKLLSSYADGIKSLEISVAANESAAKGGKPVALKLQ